MCLPGGPPLPPQPHPLNAIPSTHPLNHLPSPPLPQCGGARHQAGSAGADAGHHPGLWRHAAAAAPGGAGQGLRDDADQRAHQGRGEQAGSRGREGRGGEGGGGGGGARTGQDRARQRRTWQDVAGRGRTWDADAVVEAGRRRRAGGQGWRRGMAARGSGQNGVGLGRHALTLRVSDTLLRLSTRTHSPRRAHLPRPPPPPPGRPEAGSGGRVGARRRGPDAGGARPGAGHCGGAAAAHVQPHPHRWAGGRRGGGGVGGALACKVQRGVT